MAPSEYENLATKIDNGFSGVHARIDTFKDEFNSHRLVCKDLFAEIRSDESLRKGVDCEKASNLKSQINWGMVKTAVMVAAMSLVTVAAIKIIFTNIGKFTW